jgi:hypothetical protein
MGYIYTMRWFKVRKEKWHCNTIQLPDYKRWRYVQSLPVIFRRIGSKFIYDREWYSSSANKNGFMNREKP